jgi:hypothetical protein
MIIKTYPKSSKRHHLKCAGNVFFLILIAVILFAALGYAVTSSTRGSGDISNEKNLLISAELMSYAGAITQAVDRVIALNNCDETTINFYDPNDYPFNAYTNLDAPADGSCDIFGVGGSVSYLKPPTELATATGIPLYNIVPIFNIDGIGDNANPDILFVASVTQAICTSINTREGITNPSGDAPPICSPDFVGNDGLFITNMWPNAGHNNIAYIDTYGAGTPISGHMTGCFRSGCGTLGYIFYHVVKAR